MLGACSGGSPTASPSSSPTETTAATHLATVAPASATPSPSPGPLGAFLPVGPMSTPRAGFTATLLLDGRVLIAGGGAGPSGNAVASAEIYDPATRAFTPTASMTTPRDGHAAVRIPDGRVLISGGANCCQTYGSHAEQTLASAELFDPSTGTFARTGAMTIARAGHSAVLLGNGLVLILGGGNMGDPDNAPAELYDPTTGTFAKTGAAAVPRWGFSATLLADGRVLVTGGDGWHGGPGGANLPLASAELYDPATGKFSMTGSMGVQRAEFTATLLLTGRVLVAGGRSQPIGPTPPDLLADSELYDPVSGTFSPGGPMIAARSGQSATLLTSGRVLLVGGEKCCVYDSTNTNLLSTPELYDPASGAFLRVGTRPLTRSNPVVTRLSNGWVLLSGGQGFKDLAEVSLASAEAFIEAAGP